MRTNPAAGRCLRLFALAAVLSILSCLFVLGAAAAIQEENDAPTGSAAAGASATTSVPAVPDLALTKSGPALAHVGDSLTYTLLVENASADGATNVVVTDTLPAGLSFTSASATTGSGCLHSGGTVTCKLGTLPGDATATVTVVVTVNGVGTQTNTATVSSDEPDANEADNESEAVTSVRAGAGDLAAAIARESGSVTAASFVTEPPGDLPYTVSTTPLAGFPTHGSTYAILTTGDAGLAAKPNDSGGSGAGLGGASVRGDSDFDVTILKVDLAVPSGSNCLSLDFRFLSEEYPEYVGSAFNDAFVAELDASTWMTSGSEITAPNNFAFDPSGKVISINASGVTSMTGANAAGTTYDGATPLLRASTPIAPGPHSLYLSIFDQGDHALDSAVFLDNLVLGTTVQGTCVRGATPLYATKTADAATTPAGGENGYTITIQNPTAAATTVSKIVDDLPPGFSYVPGSTTGATTGDPAVEGQKLTWSGPVGLAANGSTSLHFRVTVSSIAGEYFNNAAAEAGATSVAATGPTAKVTVTAAGSSAHVLTVSKQGTGSGSVTSSPAGISCGSTCSASYAEGTAVTLTASAASGSSFAGWGGACAGTSPTCTVTMTAATGVTATFASVTHTLTVSKQGTGSGSVTSSPAGISCGSTCSASYAEGTAVTLTASAASGSSFAGWGGACAGTSPTCTVTMTAATTVSASFMLEAVNAEPSCAGVKANRKQLWPPDHTFRLIKLSGGTDPDGGGVALEILAVTQDEPIRGLGRGDKAPDAKRVAGHANQVKLRAERRGTGNGRVYRIKVRGSDGEGGTCSRVVRIGVPHDLTKPARDSGHAYNSFG